MLPSTTPDAAPDLRELEDRRRTVLALLATGARPDARATPVHRPAPSVVSVVLPLRDPGPLLIDQLRSLAGQDYGRPWEVVLADNGSQDGSIQAALDEVGRRDHAIRVVDAGDRPGAAHARNVGTADARGELVIYCDGDDVADPAWLRRMVAAASGGGLVAGILENDLLNGPDIRTWRGTSRDLARPLDFLPFAPSASLGVWKDVWLDVGGWREDFTFAAGEDVEFCWRAQLCGHSLVLAPEAVMHYRHRTSLSDLARQVYRYAWTDTCLYKDYRSMGARRRRPGQVLSRWSYSLTRLPYLAMSQRRRGYWVLVTAGNAGRLAGSVHHRVLFP